MLKSEATRQPSSPDGGDDFSAADIDLDLRSPSAAARRVGQNVKEQCPWTLVTEQYTREELDIARDCKVLLGEGHANTPWIPLLQVCIDRYLKIDRQI